MGQKYPKRSGAPGNPPTAAAFFCVNISAACVNFFLFTALARLLPYTKPFCDFFEGGVMKEDTEMFCEGVTRRSFMKACVTATAMMGLPFGMHTQVAEAIEK